MDQFRALLTREQIFTVPNFMSLFRLILVPFIIWIYVRDNYDVAAVLVLVSAATDILDGVIARKFNMVSDLGKVLDPICDKLTHAALLICLITRYVFIWVLLALLTVKELTTGALGAIAIKRRGEVHSARWFGKVCTVVFETGMVALMLFPALPAAAVNAVIVLCGAVMLFSLTMYTIYFLRLICSAKQSDERRTDK